VEILSGRYVRARDQRRVVTAPVSLVAGCWVARFFATRGRSWHSFSVRQRRIEGLLFGTHQPSPTAVRSTMKGHRGCVDQNQQFPHAVPSSLATNSGQYRSAQMGESPSCWKQMEPSRSTPVVAGEDRDYFYPIPISRAVCCWYTFVDRCHGPASRRCRAIRAPLGDQCVDAGAHIGDRLRRRIRP